MTISTATSGATIRYTTDGSTPSETAGTVYSSPMNISANTHAEGYRLYDGHGQQRRGFRELCLPDAGSYFLDMTTQGSWWSSSGGYIYGNNGYELCAWNWGTDVVSLTGSYVQSVTPSSQSNYCWGPTSRMCATHQSGDRHAQRRVLVLRRYV